MSDACLFCRIVAGEIPSETVYEDDRVLAFRDIDPKAPVHVLVIPRRHVSGVDDLREDHAADAAALLLAVPRIARDQGIADGGYRLVFNSGADGGQAVGHLHGHVLGGRALTWPPG
jgi:histidine triad (HIT) family protein